MRPVQRLLGLLLAIGLLGTVAGYGTHAAYTATSAGTRNSLDAGSVAISDNDSGAAMLTFKSARPGDSATSCINVTYGGSLPAQVSLHRSALTGTGLGPYMNVTITRGTNGNGGFDTCTGFVADTTDHIGAGPGVIFNGTLATMPTTFSGGLEPTPASPATWESGTTRAYRFVVTLQNDPAAQGLDAGATFTWEARSS